MTATDLLALLPASTAARALPTAQLVATAAGETVHLVLADRPGPLCGTRTPAQPLEDLAGRRVCVSCARRLPRPTRLHLSTVGQPTDDERAAVHVRRARVARDRYRDEMDGIRLDAVLDDTVGHHVLTDDGGQVTVHGGPTVAKAPMTVGLLIGTLMPGFDAARPPTAPAAIALRPSAPGRFPTDRGPLLARQQPSRRRA